MSVIGSTASGGRRKGPGGRWEVWSEGRWVPEAEVKPSPPPVSEASGPVRRRKDKAPTKRQTEVWEAVQKHGSQLDAAKALGISHQGLRGTLESYMRNAGIDGPLPGLPVKARKPKIRTKPTESDRQVESATERHEYGLPDPLPPLKESPATHRPAKGGRLDVDLRVRVRPDSLAEAYAIGFAVATLRAVSLWDGPLTEALRDMAQDAADGLRR